MSGLRMGTAQARAVIGATALGSGMAFLDGTVVNTALPAIRANLGAGIAGQQWILTGYLLALGSLIIPAGSLGDIFGRRRMFVVGVVAFAISSVFCALAPTIGALIVARFAQGVAAAALVPGSLAIISSTFHPDDRATAIGAWTGLTSVSTAVGPFVGGWLIDSVSWRLIFFMNVPLAAAAVYLTARHVPESRRNNGSQHVDWLGTIALSSGLGGVVFALIEGPSGQWSFAEKTALVAGLLLLISFGAIEHRTLSPMVPLRLFRSVQFSGANVTTFAVWGALAAMFFLLSVHLQDDLGYSALEAGAATLPVTVMMLLFASKGGALARRFGPRLPMTLGPMIIASSFIVMSQISRGDPYGRGVLPGVFLFACGLVVTVAPLTATVLASIDDDYAGTASAINNAVSRIAGLLFLSALPALSGVSDKASLGEGFGRAMILCAVAAAVGGVVAWFTIPNLQSNDRELAG
jgi:EmrB/QacA subfamily drug resistance transporter